MRPLPLGLEFAPLDLITTGSAARRVDYPLQNEVYWGR
jgi:hypothetical protein